MNVRYARYKIGFSVLNTSMTWPRLRTKCDEEICLGSLYSSRKGGGGGYVPCGAVYDRCYALTCWQ